MPGVYNRYLLVRTYLSLHILFVSPVLRLPGLLRMHIFSKLSGSQKTIQELDYALQDGAGVMAKFLWLLGGSAVPRSLGVLVVLVEGNGNGTGTYGNSGYKFGGAEQRQYRE